MKMCHWTILAVVAISTVSARATIITSFTPAGFTNRAPQATASIPAWGLQVGTATDANDERMSDKTGYAEQDVLVFNNAGGSTTPPYQIELTWGSAVTLARLDAYMASDVPSGIDTFLDRETQSVSFELDMGSGYVAVGTVADTSFIVAPNDTTAIWSLASVSGTWSGVTKARYTFNLPGGPGKRVGEVVALDSLAVPEPSAMLLIGIGGALLYRRFRSRP